MSERGCVSGSGWHQVDSGGESRVWIMSKHCIFPTPLSTLSNLADLVILALSSLSEGMFSLLEEVGVSSRLLFRLGIHQDRGYV